MPQYLKYYFIATLSLMIIFMGFNFIVDPYEYFHAFSLEKINQKKILSQDKRRQVLEEIDKIQPKSIIMGTSRSLMGLSESSFPTLAQPVLNASFERAAFYEMYRYFEYAIDHAPITEIILTLDFFSFNAYLKPLEGFYEVEPILSGKKNAWSDISKRLKALISQDAFLKSFKTVHYNMSPSAQRPPQEPINAKALCEKTERSLLTTHVFFPLPLLQYNFNDPKTSLDTFALLDNMLATAKERKIKVKLVILPMHARLLSLIDAIGLWPQFELWKQQLVKHKSDYELYDFAYLDEFSLETPLEHSPMKWYYESLHFRSTLGEKIAQSIVSNEKPAYGVILDKDNVNRLLLDTRHRLTYYQTTHTNELQTLIETVEMGQAT